MSPSSLTELTQKRDIIYFYAIGGDNAAQRPSRDTQTQINSVEIEYVATHNTHLKYNVHRQRRIVEKTLSHNPITNLYAQLKRAFNSKTPRICIIK